MGKPGESILLLNQALQEEDVGPQRSAASCQDICKGVASFVDIGVPGDDIGKSSPRDAAWRTYACRKQSRGTESTARFQSENAAMSHVALTAFLQCNLGNE